MLKELGTGVKLNTLFAASKPPVCSAFWATKHQTPQS
jgi:hypothetical protein